MRRTAAVSIALVLLLALPSAAHACAVCFDANGEVRMAFVVTTGFLTLLPLGMVASVALWIRKKLREPEVDSPSA